MYNFNPQELEELSAKIKVITGYNVLEDFYSHFDTASHYESGDDGQGGAFFDFVQDTSTKLKICSLSIRTVRNSQSLKNKLINS